MVRFSLGTALRFAIEPLASQPTPTSPSDVVVFSFKNRLPRRKKREMTPVALGLSSVA